MASWTEAKKPNQAATIVTEPDTIFVGGVHQLLHISAAQHSWFNSQKQHVIISAEIERSTKEAGIKDEVDLTVDYSFIYEALLHLNHEAYYSPLSAAKEIAIKIQDVLKPKGLHAVEVTMAVPKYLALTGGELVVKAKLDANPHPDKKDERSWSTEFQFNGLTTQCIVGVGHMERKIKQPLVISITIKGVLNLFEGDDARKIDEDLELDIVQRMMEMVDVGEFLTLEAVAHNIGKFLFDQDLIRHAERSSVVSVKVTKPAIFSGCDGPGVRITRIANDFPKHPSEESLYLRENQIFGINPPS